MYHGSFNQTLRPAGKLRSAAALCLTPTLLLGWLLILTGVVLAQEPDPRDLVASVIHRQHKIASKVLGEERTILVRVPLNYYRTDDRLPVVYMLDAHPPQNAMMVGMLEQQVWGEKIPDMILVGIQNTNRGRDLTPTTVNDGRGASGGANAFLSFIESELIPMIERTYRTEPYRILAGHSLGGLFVMHALVERPDLFNAYIAASPYLHWDNGVVLKRAKETLRNFKGKKRVLFAALGDEAEYADGFNGFHEFLRSGGAKNIDFEFQQYKDESHGSIVLPAYLAGIRKVYKGWEPKQTASLSELENHYRELSERFGYTIRIPEQTMNRIGYVLLRNGRDQDAVEIFKKNVINYPTSANVYDSLAESLEKTGNLKAARDNFEKAWKNAEKRGEQQLAVTAKANFQRVAAKVK